MDLYDEILGGESKLIAHLIAAAREGHLCVEGEGREADCDVELLQGKEKRFEKQVGKWGSRYYLQRNWVLENQVVEGIQELLRRNVKPLDVGNIEGLNKDQIEGVRAGLSESLCCLTGGPGTGKTYTIKKIIESFKGGVAVCAPTGKAAALLEEKLRGLSALRPEIRIGTLHALLGIKSRKDLLFGKNLLKEELLIVDECSMVDVGMWAHLFRGIHKEMRLILVGDHNQLPPVEVGTIFGDLCHFMKENKHRYVHLKKCMRSDQKEILEKAEKVRFGKIVSYEKLERGIEKLWEKGYQLLSCLRRGPYGTETINRAIKSEKKPIIITRTNHRLGLFNGEVGLLQGEKALFGKKTFPAALIGDYDFAYCLSVHKSQGSEFEKVALLIPKGSEVFGREILYTGITRAKEEVLLFSEEGVIEECLQKSGAKLSGIREKLLL